MNLVLLPATLLLVLFLGTSVAVSDDLLITSEKGRSRQTVGCGLVPTRKEAMLLELGNQEYLHCNRQLPVLLEETESEGAGSGDEDRAFDDLERSEEFGEQPIHGDEDGARGAGDMLVSRGRVIRRRRVTTVRTVRRTRRGKGKGKGRKPKVGDRRACAQRGIDAILRRWPGDRKYTQCLMSIKGITMIQLGAGLEGENADEAYSAEAGNTVFISADEAGSEHTSGNDEDDDEDDDEDEDDDKDSSSSSSQDDADQVEGDSDITAWSAPDVLAQRSGAGTSSAVEGQGEAEGEDADEDEDEEEGEEAGSDEVTDRVTAALVLDKLQPHAAAGAETAVAVEGENDEDGEDEDDDEEGEGEEDKDAEVDNDGDEEEDDHDVDRVPADLLISQSGEFNNDPNSGLGASYSAPSPQSLLQVSTGDGVYNAAEERSLESASAASHLVTSWKGQLVFAPPRPPPPPPPRPVPIYVTPPTFAPPIQVVGKGWAPAPAPPQVLIHMVTPPPVLVNGKGWFQPPPRPAAVPLPPPPPQEPPMPAPVHVPGKGWFQPPPPAPRPPLPPPIFVPGKGWYQPPRPPAPARPPQSQWVHIPVPVKPAPVYIPGQGWFAPPVYVQPKPVYIPGRGFVNPPRVMLPRVRLTVQPPAPAFAAKCDAVVALRKSIAEAALNDAKGVRRCEAEARLRKAGVPSGKVTAGKPAQGLSPDRSVGAVHIHLKNASLKGLRKEIQDTTRTILMDYFRARLPNSSSRREKSDPWDKKQPTDSFDPYNPISG